ncbi:DHA2 family efflux MFS transporter permease subunit [Chamaesiphon sp. OTE_20_metabat_361]|uniref:DHA2 family efflux MFS transporter permease subunit n=1 Tax=Chamaesiphon sp. OTE_20_metabat_361 TaxID=2964689 RepID=UPI00286A0A80|nr:DHA2 family efflux MFS transporter permease subunit [Chamaesiphon sp. OTE_20_metabat_361]
MNHQSEEQHLDPLQNRAVGKWRVMLGISLGVLMYTIDTSIVNIALPTLISDLRTDFATVQWVGLSYVLVVTSLVLGAARLGDMFGKKPLYLGGLIVFTISSLLCGLAPSIEALIGARALQGLGAVMISALGAAIIVEVFPTAERGKALGVIGAVVSLGIALGPSVGGVLIGIAGWRSIFLVNIPIGILASFVVYKYVPNSPRNTHQQRFDFWGSLSISIVLVCFSVGMTEGQRYGFTSSLPLGLLGTAAIGLAAFITLENRVSQPMLDFSLFRSQTFSLSLLTGWLVFMALGGSSLLIPFFLQLVMHYPIERVGLFMAITPVIGGLVSPLAGNLSDRFGTRSIMLIGLVLMTIGSLAVSTLDAQMRDLDYLVRVIPLGLGWGIFQSPNNGAILGAVPPQRLGIASGLLSLTRTLGQTTGLPLFAAIFAAIALAGTNRDLTLAPPDAIVRGFQGTFQIAALQLAIAAALTGLLWWMESRDRT